MDGNKIKKAVSRIDFTPRNSKDYYRLGMWLVSRKLAVFCFALLGIVILVYFLYISPVNFLSDTEDGIRVYRYDSVALRLVSGKVRIKAKDGHIAYVGYVSCGRANGDGKVFYENDVLMYDGEFKNNEYEGTGTAYYENGIVRYDGEFSHNEYEGSGTLYRENGSRKYSGNFRAGMVDGSAQYYDESNNLVYTGSFCRGNLLYTDFLGKSSTDIARMYSGRREVFYDDEYFLVALTDIDCVYGGLTGQNPLESSVSASEVYVLCPNCYLAGANCSDIAQVMAAAGNPVYEGNTYLNFQESVAVENSEAAKESLGIATKLGTRDSFDGVHYITDYEKENPVYIYTFEVEKIQYTFYCRDRMGTFAMYLMRKL